MMAKKLLAGGEVPVMFRLSPEARQLVEIKKSEVRSCRCSPKLVKKLWIDLKKYQKRTYMIAYTETVPLYWSSAATA